MDYMFDNFTINLGLSEDILESVMYLITHAMERDPKNLHIIDYTNEIVKKYLTIDETKSEEFISNTKRLRERIVYVEKPVKQFNWIEEYLNGLSEEDIVVINGADRLIPIKGSNAFFKFNYFSLSNNFYFEKDRDWEGLAKSLDEIYEKCQLTIGGLFTNLKTIEEGRDIFIEALSDSENMSITSISDAHGSDSSQKSQISLIQHLLELKTDVALIELEQQKNQLSEITYVYFEALVYIKNGVFSKAINALEKKYELLINEQKLILVDLYAAEGNKTRAIEVFLEISKTDKYINGLIESALRLYGTKEEEYNYWLDFGLEVDSENPYVIEAHANRLSNNNEYSTAAYEFRRLGRNINSSYYELVARINELMNGDKDNYDEAKQYIDDYIEMCPQYRNEAIYKLSLYYSEYKNSYFHAYKILNEYHFKSEDTGDKYAVNIMEQKLKILKDDISASKALGKLKVHKRPDHAKKLASERAVQLIECIKLLSSVEKGYLSWRDFISESQSKNTWNTEIYKLIEEHIDNFRTINIKKMVDNSNIKKIDEYELESGWSKGDSESDKKNNANMTLTTLRMYKQEPNKITNCFDNFDDFAQTYLKTSEIFNDNRNRMWSRYIISIIASVIGEHEKANNYALDLFEISKRLTDEYKHTCIMLGLLAWGNSQYRIGRHIEGIACTLASIEYIKYTNEIIPFLEDGLNIIARYLSDNDFMGRIDYDKWSGFAKSIQSYNKSLSDMLLLHQDPSLSIEKINILLKDYPLKNLEWATNIAQLISAYISIEEYDKAEILISRHSDDVLKLFEARLDVRDKLLLSWAQVCFRKASTFDEHLKCLNLLEIAERDIEKKRKVGYREERASVSEMSEKSYRLYIQICSLILYSFDLPDFLNQVMKDNIERVMNKLTPRSIIEQKYQYNEFELTDEATTIKSQLDRLKEEYESMFLNDSSNTEALSEVAEKMEDLTLTLKKIHPDYVQLKTSMFVKFETIKKHMNDEEMFFQCVVNDICITTICITKDIVQITPIVLDEEGYSTKDKLCQFNKYIQRREDDEDIKPIIEFVSNVLFKDIMNQITKLNIKKLYVMPDFPSALYPIIISVVDDRMLLDNIDSVINIIDYNVLLKDKKDITLDKIANRVFGNNNDPELIKINRWLDKNKDNKFLVLKNDNDQLTELNDIKKNVNTIAIYAHGVPDPMNDNTTGAKGIQGSREIINLDDIVKEINEIENLIVISCSSGIPNSNNADNSFGTWASILERFNGNIIICRWDIPTNETIELMNEIFNLTNEDKVSLDRALVLAQRKINSNKKSPYYWAGVECWTN